MTLWPNIIVQYIIYIYIVILFRKNIRQSDHPRVLAWILCRTKYNPYEGDWWKLEPNHTGDGLWVASTCIHSSSGWNALSSDLHPDWIGQRHFQQHPRCIWCWMCLDSYSIQGFLSAFMEHVCVILMEYIYIYILGYPGIKFRNII